MRSCESSRLVSLVDEFRGTDRFQILRRLGEGGMGVVYEVMDRERSARVALKTMRAIDPDAMLGFKNEFRSLADIQHANLVSLGELIGAGSLWYFTMELVEGIDFLDYVSPMRVERRLAKTRGAHATMRDPTIREPPKDFSHLPPPNEEAEDDDRWSLPSGPPANERFEEKKLRAALSQLARGLDALHRAGKVHRDIKPSNVLVTAEDRLVILDFGLVVDAAREGLSEQSLAGTAEYMAPEQAASKAVGPEADMYSVGVLLYEAMTGELPFSGTALEIMMEKQRRVPRPPRTMVPNLPQDLDRLCSELLRFDPRSRPRAADVIERLRVVPRRSTIGAPLPSVGPSSAFVGRDHELACLREAFADMARGTSQVVMVHGESGVGKSALVRQFSYGLSLEKPPVSVFAGRCYERESVPYKAFDGVIDALSRQLRSLNREEADEILPDEVGLVADVFPVLRRAEVIVERARIGRNAIDPQSQRSAFFAALRALLQKLAERRPIVVVIDDVQWADADSLALLEAVMRPPNPPKLLLLLTVRTGSDIATTPQELAARVPGEVQLLPVTGLEPDEARTLTERLLAWGRAEGTAGAARIAEESRGHPLFIDALVRHSLALGGHAPGALRLEDALWGNVTSLDAPARRVVEVVAVAGTPLRLDVAARAADVERGEAVRLSSMLRVAHLTRATGGGADEAIEPYHDRVRIAVLEHLDSTMRRDLHERIALAIEASGRPDPEALAIHFRDARMDDRAADWAAKAATRAASAFAFERAVGFYRMALELGSHDAEVARSLRQGLATALAHAGRAADAAEAFLDAAVGAKAATALQLKQRAAEELLRSGHIEEGLALTSVVLREAKLENPKTPTRALMLMLLRRLQIRLRGYRFRERDESEVAQNDLTQIDACWSASGFIGLVDAIRGSYFQAHHLLLALRVGEPYRVVRALAWEIVFWGSQGSRGLERANAVLEIARPLAVRTPTPMAGSAAEIWLVGVSSLVAYLNGRWKECVERAEEVETFYRQNGWPTSFRELRQVQLFSLTAMGFLGALDRQRRGVETQLRAAEDCGNLVMATDLRTGAQTLAWLVGDDVSGARRALEIAQRQWTPQGFHVQHFRQLVSFVQIDLYQGDGSKAYRTIASQWSAVRRSYLLRVQQVRIYAFDLRARSALAAARVDTVRRKALLAEAETHAARIANERAGWSDPIAALVRGLVATARGDRPRAIDALRAAIAGFDALGMALHTAAARRRLADLVPEDEARALMDAWSSYMKREKVVNADRMTAMIAPDVTVRPRLTSG